MNFLRHTGPSLSPFNAWLLVKGLETLNLRMRQHCESALAFAGWLRGGGRLSRENAMPPRRAVPPSVGSRRPLAAAGGPHLLSLARRPPTGRGFLW